MIANNVFNLQTEMEKLNDKNKNIPNRWQLSIKALYNAFNDNIQTIQ